MDAWKLAGAADEISRLVSLDTARAILAAVETQTTDPAVRRALRRHAPAEVQPLLAELVSAGLVTREDDAYGFHELVRERAGAWMAALTPQTTMSP